MPAYPCVHCNTNVDVREPTCKKCKSRTPFKCTQCDRVIGIFEVYGVDQLTYQKPLYCKGCGKANERLACSRCGEDLKRKEAKERHTPARGVLLYHEKCLEAFQRQEMVSRLLSIVLFGALAFGGYSTFSVQGTVVGIVAGFAGTAVGLWLGTLAYPRK